MPLPARPNLDRLRRAARDLLRARRSGDPEALARFEAALPGIADPRLAHAQTIIAREYGFAGWSALKAAVEARRARPVRPPSPTAVRAEELIAALAQAARDADPRVIALRPGVGATVTRRARDLLRQRPGERRDILHAFIRGLTHDNPRVRYECAHALDAFGDLSCRGPLVALIDDPVPRVRRMALHALSCDVCGENLFGDDDDLRRRIAERALRDPSLQVRRHAVWALGGAGGEIARQALEAALRDEDAAVRRNAAAALRRLGGRGGPMPDAG